MKIVGKYWTVHQGNEVQRLLTCCEESVAEADELYQLRESVGKVADIIRPQTGGYITIIYQCARLVITFCPVCGEKIVRDAKGALDEAYYHKRAKQLEAADKAKPSSGWDLMDGRRL